MTRTNTTIVTVVVIIIVIALIWWWWAASNTTSQQQGLEQQNQQGQDQQSGTNQNQQPQQYGISITKDGYNPAEITIKKGDTVIWQNNDTSAHTVTSEDNTTFDSKDISPGQTFSYQFNGTGVLNYKCTIHPTLKGKITVQ